ncbi:MAG: sigma-54-dependent transcriptional regulator [Saprospiraceae bacterium]
MAKILIIDDDPDICLLLNRFLTRKGHQIVTSHTGQGGLALLEKEQPELVMTDFRLGDMEGSEVLMRIREKQPDVPVLIITGYSDIRVAVNVMKQGAFDYITKPILPDEILLTIDKALASRGGKSVSHHQKPTNDALADIPYAERFIMGNSARAQDFYRQIDLVAPTNFSVIIYGESGSGKESVARLIHDKSKRSNKPFVAMDCGAISKELANSELFGHEKGSFTGAIQTKIGHFEMANGGTLLLDEVANLPYDVQVALLRVVQERTLRRIGGAREIDIDVRIIVASNERLSEACRNGRFREDLYHRFNEFSLEVPPLRERRDDIMLFARFFLKQTTEELRKKVIDFDAEVERIFLKYPWYGNVRELRNVVKRATLLTDGPYVQAKSLPFEITHFEKTGLDGDPLSEPTPQQMPDASNLKNAAQMAEYELIIRTLEESRYNKSKTARMLGIDRKTLYNKLKLFHIE